MKRLRQLFVFLAIMLMVSCTTKVEYRDRYTVTPLDKELVRKYSVAQPPMTSPMYSLLTQDQQEKVWSLYAADLLLTIGLYEANVDGLIEADKQGIEKIKQYNKEQENKK